MIVTVNANKLAHIAFKPLVSVSEKWQSQLRIRLTWLGRIHGFQMRGIIRLVDLVNREIRRIDVGGKLGLERRTDLSQLIKDNTTEEWMSFDLCSTTATKAVFSVAN